MNAELLRRVLFARVEPARGCYERALAPAPSLAGRVEIELAIDANGLVTSASSTAGTTLADAAVVACTVDALRAMELPRPEAGPATALCPIVFAPD